MENEKMRIVPDPRSEKPDSPGQAYNWGMFCHLSALLGFLWMPFHGFFFIPFGHLVAPLVVWLLKRKEYPFVDDQGKEALNFQISMTIYGLLASLLIFFVIGIFILVVLALLDIVLVIIASVKASNGEPYRYPLTIRFLK